MKKRRGHYHSWKWLLLNSCNILLAEKCCFGPFLEKHEEEVTQRSQEAAAKLAQFLKNTPLMSADFKGFVLSRQDRITQYRIFGQGEQTLLLRLCQSETGSKLLQENIDCMTLQGLTGLIGEQGLAISLLLGSAYGREFFNCHAKRFIEPLKERPAYSTKFLTAPPSEQLTTFTTMTCLLNLPFLTIITPKENLKITLMLFIKIVQLIANLQQKK